MEITPLTGNFELKINDLMNPGCENLTHSSKQKSLLHFDENFSMSLPDEKFQNQHHSQSNPIFKKGLSYVDYEQPDTPTLIASKPTLTPTINLPMLTLALSPSK